MRLEARVNVPPQSTEPDDEGYDALDEALMETFPASDPIAVSAPINPLSANASTKNR
jgi:hypothetical protein